MILFRSANFFLLSLLLLTAGVRSAYGLWQDEGQSVIKDADYLLQLNQKADQLLDEGKMDSARTVINEALTLSSQLGDLNGEAFAYLNLGHFFLNQRRIDSVFYYIEPVYERFSDSSMSLQLGNLMATAHARNDAPLRSLELQRELLQQAEEEGNLRHQIALRQNMANNYKAIDDFDSAVDNYLYALNLLEELQDSSSLSIVLDNLGTFFTSAGNYNQAEEYISRALTIALETGNLPNELTSTLNLGIVFNESERHEAALEKFNRVREISLQLGSRFHEIQALYNIGMAYYNSRNFDEALRSFEESIQMSRELGVELGIYYNQVGIGGVYKELEEYPAALENYSRALEIAEALSGTDMILEVLRQLSDINKLLSRPEDALFYLERYVAMRDTLTLSEREEALTRQEILLGIRTERETRRLTEEALEAEIRNNRTIRSLMFALVIVLMIMGLFYIRKQQLNRLLKNRSTELSQVNEKKDLLLNVLAHDLRAPLNNLQAVVDLLRVNALEKNDLENVLDQVDNLLQREIHTLSNYLQWAQSQKEGIRPDLEAVELYPLAEEILQSVEPLLKAKAIEIQNHIPNKALILLADRQMMRVILMNLISNAIKYTPKGENIEISAEEEDSFVVIKVTDSGVGMTAEVQENLFQAFKHFRRGTAGELGTGLGLAICNDFAQRQNGSLACETTSGEGSVFSLRVPKYALKP